MKHLFYSKFLKTTLPKWMFISVLSVTLLPTSCRKDDKEDILPPKMYAEENPLTPFLLAAEFTKVIETLNSGDYESGLTFSPLVKGKINAVTLKIPDVASNVRVTIWDATTKAPIRTILLDVTSSHTTVTKTIDPLILEKDKEYMISMNTNDWFENRKSAGGSAVYPITGGNIKFLNYKWKSGTAQVFPTNISTSYTAGDVSFVFQQVD